MIHLNYCDVEGVVVCIMLVLLQISSCYLKYHYPVNPHHSFIFFRCTDSVYHYFSLSIDNRTYHFQAEDEQECVM